MPAGKTRAISAGEVSSRLRFNVRWISIPRHYGKLTFSVVRRETRRGRLPARMID
jgi:hypothetical protein